MSFKIKLPDAVINDISRLPNDIQKRITNAMKSLEKFPFPHGDTIKKIKGASKPIYRLRVSDYRIIYHINMAEKQVFILCVVHRQKLEQALKTIF